MYERQLPLMISRFLIRTFRVGAKKSAVVSLFSGVGTDIIAALQLARPVAAVEKDPELVGHLITMNVNHMSIHNLFNTSCNISVSVP